MVQRLSLPLHGALCPWPCSTSKRYCSTSINKAFKGQRTRSRVQAQTTFILHVQAAHSWELCRRTHTLHGAHTLSGLCVLTHARPWTEQINPPPHLWTRTQPTFSCLHTLNEYTHVHTRTDTTTHTSQNYTVNGDTLHIENRTHIKVKFDSENKLYSPKHLLVLSHTTAVSDSL